MGVHILDDESTRMALNFALVNRSYVLSICRVLSQFFKDVLFLIPKGDIIRQDLDLILRQGGVRRILRHLFVSCGLRSHSLHDLKCFLRYMLSLFLRKLNVVL